MVVTCEHVWQEVSNYIDGELDAPLRAAIEEHLRGCKQCTAVLAGTRNVIRLYGDERFVELPAGFSQRLKEKLELQTVQPVPVRRWAGWAVAAAAALILTVGLWMMRRAMQPALQQPVVAKPFSKIPPDLLVAVAGGTQVFHLPSCEYLKGNNDIRNMKAGEAIAKGMVPCTRCLRQYLSMRRGKRPMEEPSDADEARTPVKKEPSGV